MKTATKRFVGFFAEKQPIIEDAEIVSFSPETGKNMEYKQGLRTKKEISDEYSKLCLEHGDDHFKIDEFRKKIKDLEERILSRKEKSHELHMEVPSDAFPTPMTPPVEVPDAPATLSSEQEHA